jgi:hypothetical protein
MNAESQLPSDDDDYDENEPTPEEIAQMRLATPLEAAKVDALILGKCTAQWRKVAMVVGSSLDEFDAQFPSLPYIYMQIRILELVELGSLEAEGDVMSMRTSEVRLPTHDRAA